MDFFNSQEKARRRSGLLVFLFFLATVCIVLVVYVLAYLLMLADSRSMAEAWRQFLDMSDLMAVLGGVILAIIGLGTLFKMHQLRAGGAAVAELLGGRPAFAGHHGPERAPGAQRGRGNGHCFRAASAPGVRPEQGARDQRLCRRADTGRRSAEDAQTGPRPTAGLEKAAGLAMAAGVAVSRPENLTATIGQLDETHIAHARDLRRRIPEQLMDATHDPSRVQAVAYSLLLDSRKEIARA